jgi:hypothetical protein
MLLGIVFRPGLSLSLSLLFGEEIVCKNVQSSLLFRQSYGFNHMNDPLPSDLGHIVALHFCTPFFGKNGRWRTLIMLANLRMGK